MTTTATRTPILREEIETSLAGKYGLHLNARAASASNASQQKSAIRNRDEVERLLTSKYGLGFVRRAPVAAREEISAVLNSKYGLTLRRQWMMFIPIPHLNLYITFHSTYMLLSFFSFPPFIASREC